MIETNILFFLFFIVTLIIFKTNQSKLKYANISFSTFDDSDIKIAGNFSSPDSSQNEADDIQEISSLINSERENGNLDKSRELGKRIALDVCNFKLDMFINKDKNPIISISDPGIDSKNIELQTKILFAFVSDYAINNLLPNRVISQTAYNEYMSTFKDINEDLYNNIQTSVGYSIYVLCSRKNIDLPNHIGKAFAKLCNYENDPIWEKAGSNLFYEWLEIADKRIKSYSFSY